MARVPAPDTRDRILHAASRLFYTHGVRAVGTNQIIEAACTGKKLLYQHFPTKDDLVAAYLDFVSDRRTAATDRARAEAGEDPGDQLVAIVAEVGDRLREPDFHGCAFRNYLVEHPDIHQPDSPAVVAHRYLADSRAAVEELAAQLGGPHEHGTVAEQLWLLVDALYLQASYRRHLDDDLDRGIDAAVRLARGIVDAAR